MYHSDIGSSSERVPGDTLVHSSKEHLPEAGEAHLLSPAPEGGSRGGERQAARSFAEHPRVYRSTLAGEFWTQGALSMAEGYGLGAGGLGRGGEWDDANLCMEMIL